jgi:signal transduction histidine kinase
MTLRRHPRSAGGSEAALLRRTGLRLGLQAAAIVSVIVVTLTATAALVMLRSQHTEAATLLGQAIERAVDVLDPPAGVYLVAHTPNGTTLSTPGLPAGLPDSSALRRTEATGVPEGFDLHLEPHEYRVETVRRADGVTLEAILDLQSNHTERDRLITAMLFCGGLGLLLAAAAGAWLGTRATQPLSTALALQHRFISDASHELRTPLTLLSTRAQLLRRRLQSAATLPDALDAAEHVVADARRLADILDDLLLAADPASTKDHVEVDLAALAAEVAADSQPRQSDPPIEVTGPPSDTGTGPGTTAVCGSPVALRRAITALVDNAVRHAHRSVCVSVHRTPRHVVLEVADDGPGVDRDLAPRLFERFVTTRAAGPDGRRHYGLGLALVNDTVTNHGGRVELVEPDREGTILRVTLPAAKH